MGASTVDEFTVPKAKGAKATSHRGKFALALDRVRQALQSAAISPWKWMAISCLIVGSSGGFRLFRDRQISTEFGETKVSPFPLSEIPRQLGDWRMVGLEKKLEPDVAKIAGANDDFTRTYEHVQTGERVWVLVLHGQSSIVSGHNAEACSPSMGFKGQGTPTDGVLRLPDSDKIAQYRTGYYTKKTAGVVETLEIIYSFRNDGRWVSDATIYWKKFRSHPSMFKIQIERMIKETPDDISPSVNLLEQLMQEIEVRRAKGSTAPASSSSAGQSTKDRSPAGSVEPAIAD